MSSREWKRHSGHLAVPTLALAAALTVATTTLALAGVLGWIPLWAASVLLVPVAYLWFTPLHEAVHGNIGGGGGRGWIDVAIGWVAALVLVAPFPAFKAVHLRHHGTVNREGRDPDLWVAGSSVPAVIARCLTIAPHYYWKLVTEMRSESAALRTVVNQATATFGVLGLVWGLASWSGLGAEVLALWVVPGWLASALLALAFDWLPHHPHGDAGRYTNARLLDGGRVLTVLMVAQDAHLIHHLWPRVPFYRYHTVLRATRDELAAEGAITRRLGG